MPSVGVLGTGMAVPEKVVTNFDLEKFVDTSDEWIRTRTGIQKRRVAESDQLNSDFAARAAQQALANAGVDPEDVDLIILATVTGDKIFPASANHVQNKIGATNAFSFDINAACSGFIYALITAESHIKAGTCRHVLVVGSEIMSRILNWEDRATCVLFGDGAGAVVLGPVEAGRGILSRYMRSDGRLANLLHQPAGGTQMPFSQEVLDQKLHYVQMSGNEVFKHAVRFMGESATIALEKAGISQDELTYMIPHQANIRIIDATAKRIKLPPEKVYINIQNYGNTTAASIPIALHELVSSKKVKSDDHVLLVAFGAGFTWGSTVLKL